MKTLTGIDLSHWNTITNISAVAKNDFVILKASEGSSIPDGTYRERADKLYGKTKLGAYHFARGSNVNREAYNFLKAIESTKPSIVALDVEVAFSNTVNWCAQWLRTVHSASGILPHIYLNRSYIKRYQWGTVASTYPLWLALYREVTPADYSPWKNISIWQHTSTGKTDGISGNVDLNKMYITEDTKMELNDPIKVRDALRPENPDRTISIETLLQEVYNRVSTIERNLATLVNSK